MLWNVALRCNFKTKDHHWIVVWDKVSIVADVAAVVLDKTSYQ